MVASFEVMAEQTDYCYECNSVPTQLIPYFVSLLHHISYNFCRLYSGALYFAYIFCCESACVPVRFTHFLFDRNAAKSKDSFNGLRPVLSDFTSPLLLGNQSKNVIHDMLVNKA